MEDRPERLGLRGDRPGIKLLFYSKPFWPMVGGVETYGRLLMQGLGMESGYELTVATAALGPFTMPGANVRIVRAPSLTQLWRLIRRSDIVMLAGPVLVPLALGLLARKPVVIEHHGYQACCPNGLLLFEPEQSVCPERFLRGHVGSCLQCNWNTMGPMHSAARLAATILRRWMCCYAAANICVSNHVSRRVGLPKSRVIYHGLPENYDPAPSVPAARNTGPVVFAYVGRIVGEKGLPVLLAAASILKKEGREFALRLIGDGPDRRIIERLAQKLDLTDRLVITGFLEADALRTALIDVRAVVMPSIWEETAGLAALEQMMRGQTAVVADIGGLSEMVGATGLKFHPAGIAGLADRMRQVFDNTNIVKRLTANAGKRAQQLFRQKQMVAKHIQVLREVGTHITA